MSEQTNGNGAPLDGNGVGTRGGAHGGVPLVPNVSDDGNGAQGFLGPAFDAAVVRPVVTPTEALLLHGMPPANQKDFLFGREGPWPQPSPSHPLGQAPAVVHLPLRDQVDWQVHIGARYMATLLLWWPVAAAKTAEEPSIPEVSDEELDRLLTTGIYSKFLTPFSINKPPTGPEQVIYRPPPLAPVPTFASESPVGAAPNPTDPRVIFHDIAATQTDGNLYIVDFTPIQSVRPYQGMYVAPTISLVRKDKKEAPGRVLAIYINGLVLTPSDGAAWRLAKYFVLQGASYGTLFTIHPNIHFPYDPLNAITISSLPKQHVLLRLLEPHLRFSLVLNNAVLESPGSVISNYRATPYDPFTARMRDGLSALFNAGYAGIPGNTAYPPFTYPMKPREYDSDYGIFLSAYYPAFRTFVSRVLSPENVGVGDRYVTRWARYINEWIPSFPDGDTIWKDDRLIDAVAGFMWDVTVGHAADHAVFAERIRPTQYCLRLRLPPPAAKQIPDFDRRELSTPFDVFKAVLATKMFFAPSNVTLLYDTRYRFDADTEPGLIAAQNAFHQDLRATEAQLKANGIPIYVPLEKISRSIQY